MSRNLLVRRRFFDREGKSERRTFCGCELCRLRFGRMLYNRFRSGEPLRSYRRYPRCPTRRQRIREASAKVAEHLAASPEARALYEDWGGSVP